MTETTRTRKAGLDAEAVRISRDAKELRASMKGKEMTEEMTRRMYTICLYAALVFAWLCGFCGGVLYAQYTDADQPTAREQQVERSEGMGK